MFVSRHAAMQYLDATQRPSWVSAGDKRRMDPLTYRACQCVAACLDGITLSSHAAVIFASAYGSIHSTLKFADSMAAYGDEGASPTPFTSSVHNATAGTLCQLLELHGPSTTISENNCSITAALRLAHCLLLTERCEQVLLVAGEEHHPWSLQAISELTRIPWVVSSGMSAILLQSQPSLNARKIYAGSDASALCIDNGGMTPRERRTLTQMASDQKRLRAPDILSGWWPTGLLAALPLKEYTTERIQLRECDGPLVAEWLLDPLEKDDSLS